MGDWKRKMKKVPGGGYEVKMATSSDLITALEAANRGETAIGKIDPQYGNKIATEHLLKYGLLESIPDNTTKGKHTYKITPSGMRVFNEALLANSHGMSYITTIVPGNEMWIEHFTKVGW